MSLGNPAVDVFSIYEPRMNLSNVQQRQFAICRGGNTITSYIYNATSMSNSSINFQCNPPSRSTVLDRVAILKMQVELTFNGTTNSPNTSLLQPGFDAFRAWPISSCTNQLNCAVNGYGLSIEVSKMIHALSRFNEPHDLKHNFLSLVPQMDDNCQDYRSVSGSNSNPLAVHNTNPVYPARGGYPFVSYTPGTTTTTIVADLYEYVVLPPFIFDGSESGGLTHIDTLNFTYSFGNLQRMWSHCPNNNTISSLNVKINNASMLLFYITPRITDFVPETLVYPYYQLTNYRTQDNSSLVYNTSSTLTTNVIQLQCIPSRIFIYVKQSDTIINSDISSLISCTDSFMKINSLQVNWNNINGIYSNADPAQLYLMTQQNGCTMSWNEWFGVTNGLNVDTAQMGNAQQVALTGSILCLEPGKDLPLRDDEAPGMLGQYNLQIQINVTNINPYSVGGVVLPYELAYQPEINIICVYDGILTIQNNSTLAQIGIVSKEDALTAPTRYDLSFNALENMYGGNFFTKVRDWFKNKAIPWVKEHGPQIAKVASMAAPLVGLGAHGELGGAHVRRRSLRHRLRDI
jgi:hypothetical protein